MVFLTGIARIRGYYRTLGPQAARQFAAEGGRWPEASDTPALRLGRLVGFITTTASMVAFINSIVAGVGVALLAGDLLPGSRTGLAALVGLIAASVLMVAFLAYQRWRFASSNLPDDITEIQGAA